MGQPGGAPAAWVQLMPFVLVLAIFYFIILLPMRRRQQKVQAFLSALKVGDRVVTSGGLHGTVTRLDLKGGVHLVMRVNTDDALRLETETTAERLREALTNTNPQAKIEVTGPSEFRVEGIKDDQAFRQASADIESIFTRSSGTGSYTFTMRPNVGRQLREDTVNQALQTIERRVNELGVAEPIVARHGSNDQILVQLPGVAEVNRAKEIIGRTAILELKLAEQGPFPTREAALQAVNNTVAPDMEIVTGTSEPGSSGGTPSTTYYIVKKVAAVTGRDLRNARPTLDQNNKPAVSFSLNQDGARKFGQFTGSNIGRNLAIILDNRVFS